MSSATILPDAHEAVTAGTNDPAAALVGRCLEDTIDALRRTRSASDEDLVTAYRMVEQSVISGHPMELLIAIAKVQGVDEEHMGEALFRLSGALASTMSPPPPMIPFAGKLIAPSSFYESFQKILNFGRALLAPVVFAEDTDTIGTGSINPIAARLLAERIHQNVERRFGIKPFMTVVRLDYENWTFLTRKHFGL